MPLLPFVISSGDLSITSTRLKQKLNAPDPILVTPLPIVTLVSLEQFSNAEEPIIPEVITTSIKLLFGIAEIADAGIVAFAILHPLNATESMLVTPLPIVMLVRLLHPSNAEAPMLVTPIPIVTLVSLKQFLNAEEPIIPEVITTSIK